jgi:hypothetical protein
VTITGWIFKVRYLFREGEGQAFEEKALDPKPRGQVRNIPHDKSDYVDTHQDDKKVEVVT